MSMAVADSQSTCTKQFNILYFTPYFVLPDGPLSGTPQIAFHLVNVDKSQLNLQQAVADASAVAGLVSPGAHAIATLTAISQGGGVTKAQQAIDAAVNGSKTTQGTIDLTLPAVKAQTQWTVPIVARSPFSNPTHFADADFDLTVLPSRFTTLSTNEDPHSFDFSRQNRFAFTSVATIDATSKTGCSTPFCPVGIGDFITAHFPGGSTAYNAAVGPIERQDGSADKVEFFCKELDQVFNAPDGLALTHNDRTLVVWAVLSGFTVWTSGSGTFTQSGNACLSPADYDYLKAVKLTLPTFPPSPA